MEEKNNIISTEKLLKFLDTCYKKALDGVPKVSPPVETFAHKYMRMEFDKRAAAKNMIHHQILKCTGSGVVTGFGGLVTLPLTVPANIGSVMYFQIRMVAAAAYMAGYDVNTEEVQTLVYTCIAGISVRELLEKYGEEHGEQIKIEVLKNIPKSTLNTLKQRVAMKILSKLEEKGLVSVGKLIPGIGAAINGGFDYTATKKIGKRAYRLFFYGE